MKLRTRAYIYSKGDGPVPVIKGLSECSKSVDGCLNSFKLLVKATLNVVVKQ